MLQALWSNRLHAGGEFIKVLKTETHLGLKEKYPAYINHTKTNNPLCWIWGLRWGCKHNYVAAASASFMIKRKCLLKTDPFLFVSGKRSNGIAFSFRSVVFKSSSQWILITLMMCGLSRIKIVNNFFSFCVAIPHFAFQHCSQCSQQ